MLDSILIYLYYPIKHLNFLRDESSVALLVSDRPVLRNCIFTITRHLLTVLECLLLLQSLQLIISFLSL